MNPRLLAIGLLALAACAERPSFDVSVQAPHTARRTGTGGFLSMEVLATDLAGRAVSCADGQLEVTVSIAGEDGHFADIPPQTWMVRCEDGRTGDLAVVVDNSGSEDGFLPWLQEGARTMVREVTARGGRASLVRVSTESSVEQPLTGDGAALETAVDALYVSNGWTALYDGVRMGNETLGGVLSDPMSTPPADDLEAFCGGSRTLGVVAFTDGRDNNSADENPTDYPGDGIDTTFEDLLNLRVQGATTPVYAIGLGRDVAETELQTLASTTGGRYLHVDAAEDLPGVFDVIGEYFDASHQVCVELPTQECGDYTVRVATTWTFEGEVIRGTVEHLVHLPCDVDPAGRVATILLTTGDPGISSELASTLARQAVEWVSPVLRPRVLVVLDDNNHGEDQGDAQIVSHLLGDVDNLDVRYAEEPAEGLTEADVAEVDVVWFSNPGYPMDDQRSFTTLQSFSAGGGGLVFQGDDMTWSWGQGFSMSPLTHLDHVNNGTSACGRSIDNNRGGHYRVTFEDVDHPVTRGLVGTSFRYGNDIDHSRPRGEGEIVLASAVPDVDPGCMTPVPVVVGFDPE